MDSRSRPVETAVFAAVLFGAGVATAGPAVAESFAHLEDTMVTAFVGCAGSAGAEAMIAPLQEGDRVETGVRVSVRFASDNHDEDCGINVTAAWSNLDTGGFGSEEFWVASTADPASGGHYGTAGYNRANFWTGAGHVALTVSTHPGAEMNVTV